ncbi:MAG: DNA methyltransferase [Planctomycetota bacterium]|nr:DNA methyltransferase [Planctomycetota bacterium]MDA1113358.1 DNA methyltransferase [Planctomycetota bacterium]
MPSPKLSLQTTTLWEYPSQHYGDGEQGSKDYRGATPSYIIWNLLQRYTKKNDLVVDPFCGSGTTLDVAADMKRKALGYDLQPHHPRVIRADARDLPLENNKADFVFMDPPYGDNLTYSGLPECIGELPATDPRYLEAFEHVFNEAARILRPGRYLAVYVSDVWKSAAFVPIGSIFSEMLAQRFLPVDHIVVARGNKDLEKGNYHKAAEEENFFLRGFNHLLIFKNPEADEVRRVKVEGKVRQRKESREMGDPKRTDESGRGRSSGGSGGGGGNRRGSKGPWKKGGR